MDYKKATLQVCKQVKKNYILFALAAIFFIGIFLRSYNFSHWLIFQADQKRDLSIVEEVVQNNNAWPVLGPHMRGGNGFRLGPIYYYFQIISAKIFGVGPTQQAYPDWIFSVLSIPLLYYFLTRYFKKNISLMATGIYTCSFFMIIYSRFAWNINPVPFFSILFLLALWEFLDNREKTKWLWIVLLGLSLGVGIQLHAILLVLLITMVVFFGGWVLIKDPGAWIKILAALLIALVLNSSQIISELKTGFSNTKVFFLAINNRDNNQNNIDNDKLTNLGLDIACNASADLHILSSLGDNKFCNFLSYKEISKLNHDVRQSRAENHAIALLIPERILSIIFLILGAGLFSISFLKERDIRKKRFLVIILCYQIIFFCLMFREAPDFLLRYFLAIAFVPFMFFAFILKWIIEKYPRKGKLIAIIIFIVLLLLNVYTIGITVNDLIQNKIIYLT